MPSIPNNLSPSEQAARIEYLSQSKQNWFKYGWLAPGVNIPSIDPASIPLIKENMDNYWFDQQWQDAFDERYNTAFSTFTQPPLLIEAPGSYETYPNFKSPYTAPINVSPQPNLDDDSSFAGQRLWGANPLMIKKVRNYTDLPTALAVKDGDGPDTIKLETAINENRLYICDYSDLGFIAGPGDTEIPLTPPDPPLVIFLCNKFLTAPIGLFYWEGNFTPEGQLLPYAIQLEQNAGAGVFTPKNSGVSTTEINWRIAKAAFQVADAHSHEWDSHLVRTHVVLGPFAISGERHLHPNHPVLILMRPHLRYTLAINSITGDLTGLGSYGDRLLAPVHENLMKLLKHYYRSYMKRGFHQMANLENEIAARNMSKDESPIHFPYRDDGLLIFYAIRKFVENYLDHYYANDNEVREDRELRAFVKELTDDNGGMVKGLTANGNSIESLDDLSDVLTSMIWTAGPAHAAVNFAQWDYMADPRNMPFSGYLEAPQSGSDLSLPNHVNFFPQYSLGKLQAGVMYALGTYRLDMLGHYRPKDFLDPPALKEIANFQCDLAHIGGDILAVDQTRSVTYPYLYPWLIPNSISI